MATEKTIEDLEDQFILVQEKFSKNKQSLEKEIYKLASQPDIEPVLMRLEDKQKDIKEKIEKAKKVTVSDLLAQRDDFVKKAAESEEKFKIHIQPLLVETKENFHLIQDQLNEKRLEFEKTDETYRKKISYLKDRIAESDQNINSDEKVEAEINRNNQNLANENEESKKELAILMDKVLSLKRQEAKAKFTIEEFDSNLANLANDNSKFRPKIDDLKSQSSQNLKIDSEKLLITEQKLAKMLSTLSEVKMQNNKIIENLKGHELVFKILSDLDNNYSGFGRQIDQGEKQFENVKSLLVKNQYSTREILKLYEEVYKEGKNNLDFIESWKTKGELQEFKVVDFWVFLRQLKFSYFEYPPW